MEGLTEANSMRLMPPYSLLMLLPDHAGTVSLGHRLFLTTSVQPFSSKLT
jgi:hypothetical protein